MRRELYEVSGKVKIGKGWTLGQPDVVDMLLLPHAVHFYSFEYGSCLARGVGLGGGGDREVRKLKTK